TMLRSRRMVNTLPLDRCENAARTMPMTGNTAKRPLNFGPSSGEKWVTATVIRHPATMRATSSTADEVAGPIGWVIRGNRKGASRIAASTMTATTTNGGAERIIASPTTRYASKPAVNETSQLTRVAAQA